MAAASDAPEAAAAADDGATATTKVLPSADRSFFGITASSDSATPTRRAARAASDDQPRRWVRPTIAISLLVATGTVVAVLLFSTLTSPVTATTTPEPLPAVPGDLGVHLEELDEAVTGE